jgi:hypothetical protein
MRRNAPRQFAIFFVWITAKVKRASWKKRPTKLCTHKQTKINCAIHIPLWKPHWAQWFYFHIFDIPYVSMRTRCVGVKAILEQLGYPKYCCVIPPAVGTG